jgi:hypothetical protein
MTSFLRRKYIRPYSKKSITSSGSGCTCYFVQSSSSETAFIFSYCTNQIICRKIKQFIEYLYLISSKKLKLYNEKQRNLKEAGSAVMKDVTEKNTFFGLPSADFGFLPFVSFLSSSTIALAKVDCL